jgi:hypothetical protein
MDYYHSGDPKFISMLLLVLVACRSSTPSTSEDSLDRSTACAPQGDVCVPPSGSDLECCPEIIGTRVDVERGCLLSEQRVIGCSGATDADSAACKTFDRDGCFERTVDGKLERYRAADWPLENLVPGFSQCDKALAVVPACP